MEHDAERAETHLRVFKSRSEYYWANGQVEIFHEGVISVDTKKRIKLIKDKFEKGFLDSLICELKEGKTNCDVTKVSSDAQSYLRQLVELVTSEVGRALIGLTVMQLCIKTITPKQCIRLHKASSSRNSFSWVEGVSMRTLDKNYVTPALRRHDLVRLNADGFMMTRSLAENYPYSSLYKAHLRGARDQWLAIVEELEKGRTDPKESLVFLLSLLLNAACQLDAAASDLIALLDEKTDEFGNRDDVMRVLTKHAEASDYVARLLEIGMHALLQAAVESGALGDVALNPLSQMRSANKKHGNVGDIELLEGGDIIESWDAKYGKSYLREEIEEAKEKIPHHDNIRVVGFVTNVAIQRTTELDSRIDDLSSLYGVDFIIISYADWVRMIYERCIGSSLIDERTLSREWIRAYVLTLCQRKRTIAPVDEPCMEWIRLLMVVLESNGA